MPRDFMRERGLQLAAELSPLTDELVTKIGKILHGHGPRIQGLVVAELIAIYVGGHHPQLRAQMTEILMRTANDLIKFHDPWSA